MRKTLTSIIGILLCLILCGCSGQGGFTDGEQPLSLQNMEKDISEQETEQEDDVGETGTASDRELPQSDEPDTAVTSNRDLEEIKKYLAQFPSTLQELSETECYVIRHGIEYSGREYLNAFIENVKGENPGELVFVQLTTEGAPILTYLNYDGKNVYCVEDISRDGFAGGNGEKYFEKYYDSIWLTAYSDAEGNFNMSLWALWEEDMVLDLFTAHTEESVMCELPPWAKPPAP